MFLDRKIFRTVVDSTPLVSIDLIVKNEIGEYLLGKRRSRPAQGYWFVPGGRILKNESLDAAFRRITFNELSCGFSLCEARLNGSYNHFYNDSIFGEAVSTHYVVIAYEICVYELGLLPLEQHSCYRWFTRENLNNDPQVHEYTKDYFCS